MSKIIAACVGFSLLLAGCSSAIQTPPPDRKTPLPHGSFTTPTAAEMITTQTTGAGQMPGGALAAQADLAQLLGLTRNNILIQMVQAAKWSDSCLGLGRPEESCAQQITGGYLVVLQADGVEYAYHTNTDGTVLRLVQSAPSGSEQAVEVARVVLAGQLGLSDPAQVQLVEAQALMWQDACLGVTTSGVACAQVITPGFRILLAAQGGLYEFHSNLDGTQMIQVEAP